MTESAGPIESGVSPRKLSALVGWLTVGLLLLLVVRALGTGPWLEGTAALVLIGNLLASLVTVYRIVRHHPHQIFFPITCFIISSAVYFGVGPLSWLLTPVAKAETVSSVFLVTPEVLLGVMVLAQVCQIGVLVGYLGWQIKLSPRLFSGLNRIPPGIRQIKGLMILLSCWGLGIKYFLQLPIELRLMDVPPVGTLLSTANFSYAALFYYWYQWGRRQGSLKLPILMLVLDVVFGVVILAKTNMALPIICALMGFHLARPLRLRHWAYFALAGAILFGQLQTFNLYLRIRRAQGETTSVVEVVRELSDLLSMDSLRDLKTMEETGALGSTAQSRLSYVDTMAYAIDEYDSGRPFNSYSHISYFLIPRYFWPDKPKIEPGLDLTRRVVGHELAYFGTTLFGEAYFNLGWLGVLLLSIWLPGIFLLLEFPTRMLLERGRMEQVIPLFLGLYIGLRVDDYAINVVTWTVQVAVAVPFMGFLSAAMKPAENE